MLKEWNLNHIVKQSMDYTSRRTKTDWTPNHTLEASVLQRNRAYQEAQTFMFMMR